MTNHEKAKKIADLTPEQQVRVLVDAAKKTEIRSVRGNSKNRFYSHECGLSRRVVAALRKTGHGENIKSGSGANSGRWYFPIEILENALQSISSSHAQARAET